MLRENLNFGSGFPNCVFSFGPRAAIEKTSDFLHRNSVKKEANNQWPSLAMSGDELLQSSQIKSGGPDSCQRDFDASRENFSTDV